MITRTIIFADENGRTNRTVSVRCDTTAQLIKATAAALATRHSLDKLVFTKTRDARAIPEVEAEDETIAIVGPSSATVERQARAAASRHGFSGTSVATVADVIAPPDRQAEFSGGAPLNSVQARLDRASK